MRASSGAFRLSWFHPIRVLSVTGTLTALTVASGPSSVRDRFERELRSMVRARAVAVCEGSPAPPVAGNVMVFDIPSVILAQCARIEVSFDPGRTLDGWTCELLEAAKFFFSGELRPAVDRTFPLSEAAAAQQYLEEGKQFGKVVLEV